MPNVELFEEKRIKIFEEKDSIIMRFLLDIIQLKCWLSILLAKSLVSGHILCGAKPSVLLPPYLGMNEITSHIFRRLNLVR